VFRPQAGHSKRRAAEPTLYFPLFAYHSEVTDSYDISPYFAVVDTIRFFGARAQTGLAAFQQFLNLRLK
jgi:hypothetical protein